MHFYNSLTKKKETIIPLQDKHITLYVCGITPYDTTHLGHAFTYIFFDTLIRYMKFKGFKVNYTQNVTDINDRDNDILKRAKELNVTWQNLVKYWTDKFLHDMKMLNWIKPDNYLFASEQIPSMITLIEKLINNDFAYQANGGVYLDITKKKEFGKLSGFSKEEMLKVAKEFEEDVDNPDKKNPLDITLWRPTVKNQQEHIPSFDSPLGPGRPGWHIECSAMAISSLDEQIDIHGGGIDLVYPHHESEIAQSEGATGRVPFAKYWLHTGTVMYEGQKMSKSVGNLVLVSDLLKKYSPNAIRYLLLSNPYREPWEYQEEQLKTAQEKIKVIEDTLSDKNSEAGNSAKEYETKFTEAMDNDLNTPKALEIIDRLTVDIQQKNLQTLTLQKLFSTLGFILK